MCLTKRNQILFYKWFNPMHDCAFFMLHNKWAQDILWFATRILVCLLRRWTCSLHPYPTCRLHPYPTQVYLAHAHLVFHQSTNNVLLTLSEPTSFWIWNEYMCISKCNKDVLWTATQIFEPPKPPCSVWSFQFCALTKSADERETWSRNSTKTHWNTCSQMPKKLLSLQLCIRAP